MAANEVCISEYSGDMVSTIRGAAQVPVDPPLAVQVLALGVSSVPSAVFNPLTSYIEIVVSGVDARVDNNKAAPVADAALSQRLTAGTIIYRGVTKGAGNKIAVIAAT